MHYRKVRPLALQKMVKKYDGSRDPYDHVAAYRQAVHAEQVKDAHTQIEGFGLTLEGKALTWFQTLKPGVKESLTCLEKVERQKTLHVSTMEVSMLTCSTNGICIPFKARD